MASQSPHPVFREFCYRLIAEKMDTEGMDPETLEQLAGALYLRLESKLGRNIIEYLPAEERERIRLQLADLDLRREAGSVEKLSETLQSLSLSREAFQEVLEDTLQELREEFLNR